jgi:hypothetical protein
VELYLCSPLDAIMAWNGPTQLHHLTFIFIVPTHLLTQWVLRALTWGKCEQGVKLPTHLNLVLKWRICGHTPPLSHTFFRAWSLVMQKENFICTFTDLCQVKWICSWLDICRHMRISKDNINEHGMATLVDCIHTCIPFPYLFK